MFELLSISLSKIQFHPILIKFDTLLLLLLVLQAHNRVSLPILLTLNLMPIIKTNFTKTFNNHKSRRQLDQHHHPKCHFSPIVSTSCRKKKAAICKMYGSETGNICFIRFVNDNKLCNKFVFYGGWNKRDRSKTNLLQQEFNT